MVSGNSANTFVFYISFLGALKFHLDFCVDLEDIVKLQVLGLGLGVDFTFALDNNHNNNNDNHNNNDNDNINPHLNFFKGTVLGVKEQRLGIRDKGKGMKDKGQVSRVK